MIRKVEEIVNFGAGIANVPLEALADGDQPHVAILLALYDGGDMLGDQLDSIAAQTHPNWSLIVLKLISILGLGKELRGSTVEISLGECQSYMYYNWCDQINNPSLWIDQWLNPWRSKARQFNPWGSFC